VLMFDRSHAVARAVLARGRPTLRAVFDRFDDEVLLCDCANGAVSCEVLLAERETP
jgi:hypothetical protein